MAHTIYAAFANSSDAERAAGALLDHGVQAHDLSVVRANGETEGAHVYEHSHGTLTEHPQSVDASGDIETSAKQGISTTSPSDAGAGAMKGTAWGAGLGALAALAALTVPGVGIVLGGGALAAGLGAVAASAGAGAVAGAVTGYLKDQGVDEHVAHHYESAIGTGGALLAIAVPSGEVDEPRVREVLEKYGATQINSYAARGYVA